MSRIPLDRWKPQEPPSDFLDRVDLALDREAARPPSLRERRGLLAGLSAAAMAAGIGAVWGNLALSRRLLAGSLVARVRTEIAVAHGVIAVAEQGARLSFRDGLVEQQAGEVSYRTAPDAQLRLSTPTGAAEGRGACCRVKVISDPDPDLGTSGPSTVLALFQGEVTLRHGGREERLSPSRYALASGGSIQTDRDDRQGRIARALSLPAPPASATPPASAATPASAAPTTPASAQPVASATARPPRPQATPPGAPASASAAASVPAPPPSARPFIVPRCICVPSDSFCACPE
jgi:hypothetical protein